MALHRRFASVAILTAGALALVVASSAGAASTANKVGTAKAMPFVTGHVYKANLSFPPTNEFCLTYIGIHCYGPNQYEKAYNLDPLWSKGIKGGGHTIVIVDSFGSPTIAND